MARRSPLALLRSSSIDLTALRNSAPFRRLFSAQLVSSIGSQVTTVALMFQIYQITKSSFAVGMLGLVQVVPILVFALVGGAIADAVDRRKLLVFIQLTMLFTTGTLAVLALGSPPVWALYVIAAVHAALYSIDGPTRSAVIPMLVDDETLRSAVQLREVLTQSGRVFGPLIGGALIATVSLSAAYTLDALSFLFAMIVFFGLPSLVPTTRRRFEFSSITEGLRYVRASRALSGTFAADLIAMIAGMPRAVFPAMAATTFATVGPDSIVVGLLNAAPAFGALAGLLMLGGLTARVEREGLVVLVSIALWGLAIALFGLSPWFIPGLIFLALAGAADMVSAVFRQTILLDIVPDELRGRTSSVHILVVSGGPPIGDFEAGAAATFFGVRTSIVLGGGACMAGMALLAAWNKPLRTHTRSHHETLTTSEVAPAKP
ncbi:MAG: MFS transporter [Thermoleophilia bacterium]|nr:MFS transporter [Thermoleophilia bacterium]